MKQNLTYLIVTLLAALVIGLGIYLWLITARDTDTNSGPKPIVIGSIFSHTAAAVMAKPYKNAVDLAVEEINANGGTLGRPLQIIYRDDKGQPGEAVRLTQELILRDKVDFLMGGFYSHVGLAISDIAKRHKKLYMAVGAATDKLLWSSGHRYVFRTFWDTAALAGPLAEEAAKLPAKRWATIASNYEFGHSIVEYFKKFLREKRPDVEFVAERWPTLSDIKAPLEVLALQKENPEAIFTMLLGSDQAEFIRDGHKRGLFEQRFVVSHGTGFPEYLNPLGSEAPEGWITNGYPHDEIKGATHEKFLKAYQRKYNKSPDFISLLGYSATYALKAAIEKAGTTETEAVVDALTKIKIDSPIGPVSFNPIDHQATLGIWVGKIGFRSDGKPRLVDWKYKDGAKYRPSDEWIKAQRPKE